ncbi:hypothetical protein [Caballeronia cordobensis]|uniref:hypothetical protein n=1 Tax=Caballeronia cordobensis TaxID=1353886 RepID=UPI00045EE495|nr:integrase family protein [Burkholderia sp. RPE67]
MSDLSQTCREREREVRGEALTHWRRNAAEPSLNVHPPPINLSDPEAAYNEWQREEATGADRRAFAERSIVQHRVMFARFHRYLVSHRTTLTAFGANDIDGFFRTSNVTASQAPQRACATSN